MNVAFVVWMALAAAPADAWPGFNGAGATAIDPATVPVKWSPTENLAWKTTLPDKGQSSPVVWGDRVFVTYVAGPNKEESHVAALDLADGKIVWDHSTPSPQKGPSNYYNARSAPTPSADAERVYAFFETGAVVALDHAGEPAWTRDLTKDYGEFKNEFGLGSSPVLVGDLLVILIDHEGPSYLLGLDKKTGETKWKTDRASRRSWSSPIAVAVGDSRQIVCSSDGSVDGYDAKTGERLWTYAEVGGNTSCSPYPLGDSTFLVGASLGMQADKAPVARKSNMAMRIKKGDSGWTVEPLWRTEQAQPTFASPMAHAGKAYWVNRSGVVFCFDAQTGEALYNGRLPQSCWATPIGVGDRVCFFGKDGITAVLDAGRELKIVAENTLWNLDEIPADTFGAPRPRGGEGNGAGSGAREGNGRQGEASAAPATGTPARSVSTTQPASNESSTNSAATAQPAANQPAGGNREGGRRGAGGPGAGGLPADGAGRFPDPIQYGAAIVDGHVIVRTGAVVYCVRQATPKQP